MLCLFVDIQYRDSKSLTMTDYQINIDVSESIVVNTLSESNDGEITEAKFEPVEPMTRPRRKLGRTGSKSWFNKSLDQNMIHKSTKQSNVPTIRRQNSVTDFFQNVFTKSKSHLQDIFTLKREKPSRKTLTLGNIEAHSTKADLKSHKAHAEGANGGLLYHFDKGLNPMKKEDNLHSSCPTLRPDEDGVIHPVILKSKGSLNTGSKTKARERRRFTDCVKIVPPTNMAATMNMFIVTGPSTLRCKTEDAGEGKPSQNRVAGPEKYLQFSSWNKETWKMKLRSSATSLVYPCEVNHEKSPKQICTKQCSSKETLSPSDFTSIGWDEPVSTRRVSSLPSCRQSISSSSILSDTDNNVSKKRRALVKSSSDTTGSLNLSCLPKTSSVGDFYKIRTLSSLVSSMSSLGKVMISITDYLFLGNIEAAYNEPLLCKYNISSLIDMANVNPSLLPPNKKSDCPCACSSKTHFRSKLNIGVDDIEWENLEQYFDEINAFIHGARRKGRRVLVFSYMGQSRAATAVIQHIMQHYRIPFKQAFNVVKSKWPQTKLNSGFIKTLLRLEERLQLHDSDNDAGFIEMKKPEVASIVFRKSGEELNVISSPPEIRGAWLEC